LNRAASRCVLPLASSALCCLLAACAMDRMEEQAPAEHRPLHVGQADDGRFQACLDCERPTPKTAGRPIATAQRAPAAGTAKPVVSPDTAAPSANALQPGTKPEKRSALRLERTSVSFETGSAQLNEEARQRLQRLVPLISRAQSARVVGFTDDLGAQHINDQLATARALAVMLQLRRNIGQAAGPELAADGRGKCCYLNDNRGAADRARNRRVEVQMRFEDTPAVDRLIARHIDALDDKARGSANQRADGQVGALQ